MDSSRREVGRFHPHSSFACDRRPFISGKKLCVLSAMWWRPPQSISSLLAGTCPLWNRWYHNRPSANPIVTMNQRPLSFRKIRMTHQRVRTAIQARPHVPLPHPLLPCLPHVGSLLPIQRRSHDPKGEIQGKFTATVLLLYRRLGLVPGMKRVQTGSNAAAKINS